MNLPDMTRLHRKGLTVSSALLLLCALGLPAQQAPALKQPVGEIAGSLVIVGGGTIPDSVRAEFVRLAGSKNARIVVIRTASADADGENAAKSLEPWKKLEPASLVLLHTRKRDEADSPDFVKPLTEATGVWLGGGDQAKLTAAYRGTLVEKELHKLLSRGGVIGGSSAGAAVMSPVMITGGNPRAEVAPGFGFLPGAIVDQHFIERKRQDRLTGVLPNHPGYFGLGIDEGTAVIVKRRQIRVLGSSEVIVCQSAGGGKPASSKSLKAGQEADLIALSRSAFARAQEPFPPARPQPPRLARGTLIIGGGGGLSPEIWKRFIELAGGPDSLILVVPTANPDPLPPEPIELKSLRANGAKKVKILHTRSRAEADTPEFAAKVNEARGVWFTGGRQWRFVDSYEGTRTEKAFHDVLARGGVIGGSSAGASIQSDYMPRGDPLGNLNIIAEGYERGFGFLKGVAVDQHFFARKRTRDMTELMNTYPQLLGIGIDEGTVIIVQEATMEVAGKSKVAVYDRRKPVKQGENDYEELPAGAKYDLEKRQRLEKP
jgi:cyanophycinase